MRRRLSGGAMSGMWARKTTNWRKITRLCQVAANQSSRYASEFTAPSRSRSSTNTQTTWPRLDRLRRAASRMGLVHSRVGGHGSCELRAVPDAREMQAERIPEPICRARRESFVRQSCNCIGQPSW